MILGDGVVSSSQPFDQSLDTSQQLVSIENKSLMKEDLPLTFDVRLS